MLHRLALPSYESIRKFEGKGNFAVGKYYKFPFKFFYRQKLRMIMDMFETGRMYGSILDFGCGKAQILRDSLEKKSFYVKCVDILDWIDYEYKYDVVVCASVLEFCDPLYDTALMLRKIVRKDGMVVVASPMKNILTRLYFWLIGDTYIRNNHMKIISQMSEFFTISDYKEWNGLYFSFKGHPR